MEERQKLLHGHWTGDGRVLTSKRPEPLIAMRDVDLPRLRSVSDRLYTTRSVMWDCWYRVVKERGHGVETGHRWAWPDREPLEQHELDLKKLKRRRPKPPLVRPHPVEEDPSGERTTGYTVDL